MLRVALKILLAGAALAAVWTFVPVGGRTMASRWRRAGSPAEFVDRTWAELRGAQALANPSARPAPRTQTRGASPGNRPSESHSDTDRRELDRILSRHLAEQ